MSHVLVPSWGSDRAGEQSPSVHGLWAAGICSECSETLICVCLKPCSGCAALLSPAVLLSPTCPGRHCCCALLRRATPAVSSASPAHPSAWAPRVWFGLKSICLQTKLRLWGTFGSCSVCTWRLRHGRVHRQCCAGCCWGQGQGMQHIAVTLEVPLLDTGETFWLLLHNTCAVFMCFSRAVCRAVGACRDREPHSPR